MLHFTWYISRFSYTHCQWHHLKSMVSGRKFAVSFSSSPCLYSIWSRLYSNMPPCLLNMFLMTYGNPSQWLGCPFLGSFLTEAHPFFWPCQTDHMMLPFYWVRSLVYWNWYCPQWLATVLQGLRQMAFHMTSYPILFSTETRDHISASKTDYRWASWI